MESSTPLSPGLYLVATPIGNLEDISARAISTLKECDFVLCEDTRHSQKLFNHLGIKKDLRACHDHNEGKIAPSIAEAIQNGSVVALVSDAGTPAISDPGFRVVRECRRQGLAVYPIPGATAIIAALSASGLPTDQFHFLGFPPNKKASRVNLFQKHAESDSTLIFYESVHRIESCLRDIEVALGPDRIVCVARELTKRFEEMTTGPISEVAPKVLSSSRKGEFVVLIAKASYQLEG